MKVTQPRVLIVDDNPDIHRDFRKVLVSEPAEPELENLAEALFGDAPESTLSYTLDSAFQGAEAIEMVRKAMVGPNRYGLAFVDVRMPPGMDGVQTIQALRKIDPALDCVICTAYSDYTPEAARQKIGITEGLLFISKPFDTAIIRQLAKKMLDRHSTVSPAR
jgi:CheY-like chemotaxis protein